MRDHGELRVQLGQDGEDGPAAWQRTASAFVAAIDSGRLDLPLPGAGAIRDRWAAFADLAREDLSLARLGEGARGRGGGPG